jgi:hypothetical protein
MHNPDQRYKAHILYLKDLSDQAEHSRMIAALTQHRPARSGAAGRRLGMLLMTVGTWLAGSEQREGREYGQGVCQSCERRAC